MNKFEVENPKNGISIVKDEGDNQLFIWKYPIEDFKIGSQLVVHESQEAIFFRNGQALDLFERGTHPLNLQNLPLLDKLYKLPTDNGAVFHSQIYFINKTVQMAVKWGTPEKIGLIDPLYHAPLEISAYGYLNIKVHDSRKLLLKLVGTMGGIAWNDKEGFAKSVSASFRPMITATLKSYLPVIINKLKINLLQIDQYTIDISNEIREKLLPSFEEYGLTLPEFYITNISLPEDDPYFQRIKELQTASLRAQEYQTEASVETERRKAEFERQTTKSQSQIIQAQTEAATMRIKGYAEAEIMKSKGYTQKDLLQADVQKAYAEGFGKMGANGGGGSIGDLASLGVTLGAVEGLVNTTKAAVSPMFGVTPAESDTWDCTCGQKGLTGNFCSNCGRKRGE